MMTGKTQKDVSVIVETVLETIANSLAGGGNVQLLGFGTFKIKERAERVGVNPQTLEKNKNPGTQDGCFQGIKIFSRKCRLTRCEVRKMRNINNIRCLTKEFIERRRILEK